MCVSNILIQSEAPSCWTPFFIRKIWPFGASSCRIWLTRKRDIRLMWKTFGIPEKTCVYQPWADFLLDILMMHGADGSVFSRTARKEIPLRRSASLPGLKWIWKKPMVWCLIPMFRRWFHAASFGGSKFRHLLFRSKGNLPETNVFGCMFTVGSRGSYKMPLNIP